MDNVEGLVATTLPGGEGVVRLDSGDVFVSNVVTGDVIRFKTGKKRRGVLHGELLEVLKPSPFRVRPPCAVADMCGGCALQATSLTKQAALKTAWGYDAFKSFITEQTETSQLSPQTETFAGRRRVRWFVDHSTGHLKLGFHKQYSHQTIHSSKCVAITAKLDALRQQVEVLLPSLPRSIQSIQAVELSNGIHLILESEHAKPENINPANLEHIQWWWRKLETPSITPLQRPTYPLFDVIDLNPYVDASISIQIGPNDFIQGHQQGNQTLISHILAWTQGQQRIVDLFSGCGNLSLPIAAAFGATVLGAELNMSSVIAANQNAKRLKLDANYETLDLFGEFTIEPYIGADTLILDPPRKGAKNICKRIGQFFPKQIIMVNCDPAAGARDAKALQQSGFTLKALVPLDLFPHTGHVEVLSLWQPA